jgi:hypothetical protein
MATTDHEINCQRDLAEFAYDKKEEYGVTHGLTKDAFMNLYDEGEITLSTVFENLFVVINNAQGGKIKKVSEDSRDFSNNGDMKIGILKKNGYQRRFVISSVANKLGTIYFVGWNWIENKPNFYAIPKKVYGAPKQGIKIMRCPKSGKITKGKYNACSFDTFEEMSLAK